MTKNIDVQSKFRNANTMRDILAEYDGGTFVDPDLALIDDDMAMLNQKFADYSRKKLLGFKFTKHIRTHKAIDNFVSSLIPKNRTLAMYYGDGWSGTTSFRG